MVRNSITIFIISVVVVLCSFTPLNRRAQYRVKTIVIDAGHGGHDPGTHGASTKEKSIALKVALELGKTITQYLPDVKVIYTRTSDEYLTLNDRALLANKNHADLFISIHCNAVGNPSIFGTETYTMGSDKSEGNLDVAKRENSVILMEANYEETYDGFDPKSSMAHILMANYQSAYIANSLRFANYVEKQFSERVNRHSRGVKQAPFVVLWQTTMPSALVEIGYLTNAKEEKYLMQKQNQEYIASGIFRAFRDYKQEMESMGD